MREDLPGLRLAPAALASPGHLPAADGAGGGGAARGVPRARGGAGIDALVGARIALHGALRAGGDRLAEGGELQHRGTEAGADVGRGGRDHGPCGGAGALSPGQDVGQADRPGRDILPEAARVRDGGDGPEREAGALGAGWPDEGVCGRALLGAACTRAREGGGGGDGHVAAVHGRGGEVAAQCPGVLRPLPSGEAPWGGGEHGAQAERQRLRAEGDRTLMRTKYLWLENPGSMRPE